MTKVEFGRKSVTRIRVILQQYGHKCNYSTYRSPYNLIVDNTWKVEVKCASRKIWRHKPIWRFNIHRHNKLEESQIDFYILRLESVPWSKKAIHLLLRAPINRRTVTFTLRSLINQSPLKLRKLPPKICCKEQKDE